MDQVILFSLENCMKCTQTKELLEGRNDVRIVTYPHDLSEWTEEQLKESEEYNVFEDLQNTAPILWNDGNKIVGYLRIRKWIQDNK
jgi:glutaredoxin